MLPIRRPSGSFQGPPRRRSQIAGLRPSVSQPHDGTICSSIAGSTEADNPALVSPSTARACSVSSCPIPDLGTSRSEFPVVPRRCASAQAGKQRAGRWRAASVSFRGPNIERCSCCTRQEFLMSYDVFAAMDRRSVGFIQRADFVWALSALGASIDFQKTCRRAGLPAYFRDTAKEMSMEEFLRLLLPGVTASDMEQMKLWADSRKALKRLTDPGFRGSEEMQEVFQLLCGPGRNRLPVGALVQAEILTKEELHKSFLQNPDTMDLSFDEFKTDIQPVLLEKFANQAEFAPEWRAAARSMFQGKRESSVRAWEDEENVDSSRRVADRRLQLLPQLPLQETSVCKSVLGRRCKRAERRHGARPMDARRLHRISAHQRPIMVSGGA